MHRTDSGKAVRRQVPGFESGFIKELKQVELVLTFDVKAIVITNVEQKL